MNEPMSRASLRPPSIKREPIEEDDAKLTELAKNNGFAASGGPSSPPEPNRAPPVISPQGQGQGQGQALSLRERRPPKEIRSVAFNCKMKPSVKARLDEICVERGISQADLLEELVAQYE
ncbi:hypothetical protein PQU92_14010 [Asticcacaulis sp. BYS171W]|uniref:Uncharacterized protein n=1 Tax=Asticcacaulis aquaticus TaxID=2984212 RepID=A0ABT5HWU7_9CAUL|nr:hypothetical protein [Asticcacaulis aquaticus]MDC7684397.1 hypothetical protein [Asticcacaulis aquaticus]